MQFEPSENSKLILCEKSQSKAMKIKFCHGLSALALLTLSTLNSQLSTAQAQGTAFTYQGRLNASGNPANGSYDMQFYLRDALTAGNPVGDTNTLAPVAATNGLFTVMLDFGAGIFTGPARWLEIGVRTNGSAGAYTTLTPRQALTTTPYAIFSENIAGNAIATANLQNNSVTGAKIAAPLSLSGSTATGGILSGNNSGSGVGVSGSSTSAGDGVYGSSATGNGVHGVSPSASKSGVLGENTGNGIGVEGNSANGDGVDGTGSVDGVYGYSANSRGVYGSSSTYVGVRGDCLSGTGVYGYSYGTADGVYGTSASGNGVHGASSTSQTGVFGENTSSGDGVYGSSSAGYGVEGYSHGTADGVHGGSDSGNGIRGTSVSATQSGVRGDNTGGGTGVTGSSNTGLGLRGSSGGSSDGVYGTSATGAGVEGYGFGSGDGVYGSSASGNGVHGVSSIATKFGVYGENTGGGPGVAGISSGSSPGVDGSSSSGDGVEGSSTTGYGLEGYSGFVGAYGHSATGNGMEGASGSGFGVYGHSSSGRGIFGYTASASGNIAGVWGETSANGGTAVVGKSTGSGGTGVYGSSASGGYAGYFNGNVFVSGSITAGTKDFKIDHPLDPANKYLLHACVESPDVMNIYNGNTTTDAAGDATVALPDYFEALNRDFRYQLTVLGQFAQATVASKIKGNQFTIKTDKPNVEVSWQVTGIRQDAYIKAHPMVVEQDKPTNERGTYLHPELFGQPEEIGLSGSRKSESQKPLKEDQSQAPTSLKP